MYRDAPNIPPAPPGGVTEQHVHLGGSVSIYRLWEMGQMHGIRGLGSYDEFLSKTHRRPDNAHSLEEYLRIFDLVEAIQSGPQNLRESIHVAVSGAFRTGGMRRLGPGGEGADLEPALAISQVGTAFMSAQTHRRAFFARGTCRAV